MHINIKEFEVIGVCDADGMLHIVNDGETIEIRFHGATFPLNSRIVRIYQWMDRMAWLRLLARYLFYPISGAPGVGISLRNIGPAGADCCAAFSVGGH